MVDKCRYVDISVRRTTERLGPLLRGIQRSGRRTFLLTNSDWSYTRHIMHHLLGGEQRPACSDQWPLYNVFSESWSEFFDLTIVDACKPKYFMGGTPLKIIDTHDAKGIK